MWLTQHYSLHSPSVIRSLPNQLSFPNWKTGERVYVRVAAPSLGKAPSPTGSVFTRFTCCKLLQSDVVENVRSRRCVCVCVCVRVYVFLYMCAYACTHFHQSGYLTLISCQNKVWSDNVLDLKIPKCENIQNKVNLSNCDIKSVVLITPDSTVHFRVLICQTVPTHMTSFCVTHQ